MVFFIPFLYNIYMNVDNIGHCIGVVVWLSLAVVITFMGMVLNKVFVMGLGLGLVGVVMLWYLAVLPELFK